MPVSSYAVIPDVLHEVEKRGPKNILDLGIGNGMYGGLFRNYHPDIIIDGVEGFAGYRNYQWAAYNTVYEGSMPEVFDSINDRYDVVVMCDVIEHFNKEQGREVIHQIIKKLTPYGIALISTPSVFIRQAAVHGNDLEIHRSVWSDGDLPGWEQVRDGEPDKYGHIMKLFKYQRK